MEQLREIFNAARLMFHVEHPSEQNRTFRGSRGRETEDAIRETILVMETEKKDRADNDGG